MPNNDLGTAHGKIRISYDGKGADKAAVALIKMQKQFEMMNKRLESIDKALRDTDSGLESMDKTLKKTEKATRGFSSSLFDSNKGFRSFIKDTKDLVNDLQTAYRVIDKGRDHLKKLSIGFKLLNTAGQFSRNDKGIFRAMTISLAQLSAQYSKTAKAFDSGGKFITRSYRENENRLLGVRSAVTLLGAAATVTRSKILGIGESFDRAPSWVRSMNKVATVFGTVATVSLLASKGIAPLLKAFNSLGTMGFVVKNVAKIGESIGKTGDVLTKVFGNNVITKGITKFSQGLVDSEGKITSFFSSVTRSALRFRNRLRDSSKSMNIFSKSTAEIATGAALVANSLGSLQNRFQWFFKLPKPIMAALAIGMTKVLPTALYALGAALKGASNLMAGLWDGAKQLAGGLVVLPGIFASIGAVVSSLIPVFAGLKDKFKDVFSDDPAKAMEAYIKLPEHLRPIADAIKAQIPAWKELQKNLQVKAFQGLSDQIKQLADNYFPVFEKGAGKVIDSVRKMKDEFVGFLLQGQTKTDTSTIYRNTAGAILQIAKATKPAAEGLRDMAVVGTDFISSMTAFAPTLSARFKEWAATNRQNGNFMKWMEDATHGAYDLIKGLTDLTKAAFTVLTLFKSKSSDNFLDRFANSMKKLNDRVNQSAITGTLQSIKQSVQNLGTNKLDELKSLFSSLGDSLSRILPFITTVSNSFSSIFIPAMEHSAVIISTFISALNDTGLSKFIGWILGIVGAAKLLPKTFSTIIDAGKGLFGTFLIFKNKDKIIKGVEDAALIAANALSNFGGAGKKAANGLLNVAGASGKTIGVLTSLATGFAVAATAALALWALYSTGSSHTKDFNKQLDDNTKHLGDFKDALNKAFADDGGLSGHNVLTAISDGLNQMQIDAKDTADKMPGIMDHIYDFIFKHASDKDNWNPFRESKAVNDAQAIAQSADNASKGFQRLKDMGIDLNAVITSSDTSYNQLISNLRATGKVGNDTADALDKQRKVYKDMVDDFKRVIPASVELSKGIQQIAEAGGDATAKLEGMKKVLEALGILKTTALEAAADYEQGLSDLSDKVTELIGSGDKLSQSDLMTGGTFNTSTQSGRDFLDVMKNLGDEFQANVAAGANADTEYAKFQERLQTISDQTGISIQDLQKLAEQVGLTPKFAGITVELQGKDQLTQDLTALVLQLQKDAADGVTVPVEIHPGDAQRLKDEIDKIVGPGKVDVNGTNLVIKPGLNPTDLQRIMADLASHGVHVPGGPTPSSNATLPVKPSTAQTGQIGKGADAEPERGAAAGSTQTADNFQKTLDEIASKTNEAAQQQFASGEKFAEEFAKGMDAGRPFVERSADALAQVAKDRFHHSPPKKGPLSEHGDAAVYAGEQFGASYSTGLASGAPGVASAASTVAGAAGSALKNDPSYKAGQFLGQLSQINDFAAHMVDAFEKVAQTVLSIAKFASDPLGKGTFFGQSLGFKRDPTISDNDLAKRNAIAAQNRVSQGLANGQRPDSKIDPTTGLPKISGPGLLSRDASKSDIIAAITQKGLAAGAKPEDIAAAVATVGVETGDTFNPVIIGKGNGGGGADAAGLFQQTVGMWGSLDQLTDPNTAIDKYWEAWQKAPQSGKYGNDALARAQATQAPGDPQYRAKQESRFSDAFKSVQDAIKNGVSPATASGGVPSPSAISPINGTYGLPAGSEYAANDPRFPPWLLSLGQSFGLAPKTYAGHQETANISDGSAAPNPQGLNRGVDWWPIDPKTGQPNVDMSGKSYTPEMRARLDAFAKYLQANKLAEQVIYQDTDTGEKIGYPADTDYSGDFSDHTGHVHTRISRPIPLPGGLDTTGLNGSPAFNVPYGPPVDPNQPPSTPANLVIEDPNNPGHYIPAPQDHLQGNAPAPINPLTAQPYTPDEAAEYYNRPENALQYNLDQKDLNQPGVVPKTQQQMLTEMQGQSDLLQGIYQNGTDGLSTDQAIAAATQLQTQIDTEKAKDTPESAVRADALSSVQSDISDKYGLTQEQNPIDKTSEALGQLAGVAGDVFKVVGDVIDSVGATKNIADTLVRGISNTEDIYNIVDQIQTFITTAADVAGAVSSITGAIGSAASGAGGLDMGASAAIQGVAQIAGLIQSALETVNAVIDLGQEAYRIIGSYFGEFLGDLIGGPDGAIQGNAKFLLDTQTNQLLAYGEDNPQNKVAHDLAFQTANPNARNQLIGNVNVYGGPGRDPRDDTRQMMYQVKASTMNAPTGQ